jgi:hypothetical protein
MRLLKCQVFEIFFGGARGGGKTDGVLGEFGAHASRYGKDAIGLMVRRTRAELVETIERSREIYGPLGWKLNDTEKMWRAPDGARLRFAYLERDAVATGTAFDGGRRSTTRGSSTQLRILFFGVANRPPVIGVSGTRDRVGVALDRRLTSSAIKPSARRALPSTMAATNKSLAQSNKSCTGEHATKRWNVMSGAASPLGRP